MGPLPGLGNCAEFSGNCPENRWNYAEFYLVQLPTLAAVDSQQHLSLYLMFLYGREAVQLEVI